MLVLVGSVVTDAGGRRHASGIQDARNEIGRVLEAFFDERGWTHDKRDLMAEPEKMTAIIDARKRAGRLSFPKFAGPQDWEIYFASPTEARAEARRADVNHSLWYPFTANSVDGRWLVGLGTACRLANHAGTVSRKYCYERRTVPDLAPPRISWIGEHPRDPAATADDIVASVQSFFSPGADGYRVRVMEDGESMRRTLEHAKGFLDFHAPGFVWVDTVVFTGRKRADVAFRWVSRRPSEHQSGSVKIPRCNPSLNVLVQDGRWVVGRKSFCEIDQVQGLCPNGEPLPKLRELPAPEIRKEEGVPADLPRFAVVDDTGSLWVVDGGRPKRWWDAGAGGSADYRGYNSVRIGPRGELYASRGEDGATIIDRFEDSFEPTTVLKEKARSEGEQYGNYMSYSTNFSVSRHGIALLYHEPVEDCSFENECVMLEAWRIELRRFGRLDRSGTRTREPVDEMYFNSNGTLMVDIEDDSADGSFVGVTSTPNKPWAHHKLVSIPSLGVGGCCGSLSDIHQRRLVLSPDGRRVATDSRFEQVRGYPESLPSELQLLRSDSNAVEVAYRPESGDGSLGSVLDWADQFVAFTQSGPGLEGPVLKFLRLGDHTIFDSGLTFGGIDELDFAMPRRDRRLRP